MKDEGKRASVEDVLAEFDRKKDILTNFCGQTKSLIEVWLQDAGLRFQSVQARVKSREKLKDKYVDEDKNYTRLDDITDQVAFRVVTYYEDEVDGAAELIKREFEIDSARSVDKRQIEPDKFGYYALNFVCTYSQARLSQTEYRRFADICCEIQITSILRHAWSEIEHPWYDLKDAFPSNIKRRFARMAALLEIAESEFVNLRKLQSDYALSADVHVAANSDLPVDSVSMRSFIELGPLVTQIDEALASVLGVSLIHEGHDNTERLMAKRATVAKLAGMTTLHGLSGSLTRYKDAVVDFVRRFKGEIWPEGRDYPVTRGVSIYYLSLMLMGARGAQEARKFMESLEVGPIDWDFGKLAAIAKGIVARY
jgi:putative GTP pyrophosphokinase